MSPAPSLQIGIGVSPLLANRRSSTTNSLFTARKCLVFIDGCPASDMLIVKAPKVLCPIIWLSLRCANCSVQSSAVSRIPTEIWEEIFGYSDRNSRFNAAVTCSQLRAPAMNLLRSQPQWTSLEAFDSNASFWESASLHGMRGIMRRPRAVVLGGMRCGRRRAVPAFPQPDRIFNLLSNFPNLTDLSIWRVSFPVHRLPTFLDQLPSLVTLSVFFLRRDLGTQKVIPLVNFPSSLRTLTIRGLDKAGLNGSEWEIMLFLINSPSVRALDLDWSSWRGLFFRWEQKLKSIDDGTFLLDSVFTKSNDNIFTTAVSLLSFTLTYADLSPADTVDLSGYGPYTGVPSMWDIVDFLTYSAPVLESVSFPCGAPRIGDFIPTPDFKSLLSYRGPQEALRPLKSSNGLWRSLAIWDVNSLNGVDGAGLVKLELYSVSLSEVGALLARCPRLEHFEGHLTNSLTADLVSKFYPTIRNREG
ncbi:hypothetical protein PQX77_015710 [Marasmius sp. AFHP31]|nr:hypothetical protein PQX77_015710 [Marasmius sp. AFHP31]